MERKFGRLLALVAAFGLLYTSCLDDDKPAAPAGKPVAPPGTEELPVGSGEVIVGLERDVYAIPSYTNAGDDVWVVCLPVSMNVSDYGISISGVMVKTFVDRAEELSGSKVVIQVFPASRLTSTTNDIVSGLVTDVFEMSGVGQANRGGYTAAFTPPSVPFLHPSEQTAHAIMSGEIGDGMRGQLLVDIGLHTAGFMHLSMHTLSNDSKEIHNPTGMKSMKLRVQSDPTQIAVFEELGASVMTTSFFELLIALQQGLYDGRDNPIVTTVSQKFCEMQSYITMFNHPSNSSMVVMGDTYYQSLSAEEQSWIDQVSQDATGAYYQTMPDTTQILIDQLTDYGIDVTYLTDEEYQVSEDSVPDTWVMYEEAMGANTWSELLVAVEVAQSEA